MCVAVPEPGQPVAAAEAFTIALDFGAGSTATILYGPSGSGRLGKEYVEVHAGGRSGVLDDFRSLSLLDERSREERKSRSADKGHRRQFSALRRLIERADERPSPDPLVSMAATLAALESARTGRTVLVEEIWDGARRDEA